MVITDFRAAIRRGVSVLISLPMVTVVPFRSIPWRSAAIPMTVIMQFATAVATRSVGEKLSPLPWLSTGASVMRVTPEGPWVELQRRPPS